MSSLVSILIPAYNAERWIADTLRSAIAQTWSPKEIIVVDDGSSDRTLDVARQFESAGVRVVTQKNQGAAAARNKALSISQGDYIQWLDADDLLARDKIAQQMKVAALCESKNTLLSSAWGSFMHRYYRAKFLPTALWCDLSPGEWLLRKMQYNLHMQTATWLTSRELAEAAGPWDTNLAFDDDGEYFCRVISASDSVRFVGSAKVYYRMVGTMRLSYIGQSTKKLEDLWNSMQRHVRYLRSLEESPRVRTACIRYMQNWITYFYPERLDIVEQAEKLARELGGELQAPSLPWKYSWIEMLFGKRVAKRAQLLLPAIRWGFARQCDRILFFIENGRWSQGFGQYARNRTL
jgi:glycosyltransferase involved in cell wall biosynthesis